VAHGLSYHTGYPSLGEVFSSRFRGLRTYLHLSLHSPSSCFAAFRKSIFVRSSTSSLWITLGSAAAPPASASALHAPRPSSGWGPCLPNALSIVRAAISARMAITIVSPAAVAGSPDVGPGCIPATESHGHLKYVYGLREELPRSRLYASGPRCSPLLDRISTHGLSTR